MNSSSLDCIFVVIFHTPSIKLVKKIVFSPDPSVYVTNVERCSSSERNCIDKVRDWEKVN